MSITNSPPWRATPCSLLTMNAEQIMPGRLTIIVPLATIIKHILPSPPPVMTTAKN